MSGCDHPPARPRTLAEQEAATLKVGRLFRFLAYTEGLSVDFIEGAMLGYSAREHVDECHPDQIEQAMTLFLAAMPEGDKRRGWVVGYRFNETRGDAAAGQNGNAPDA